MIIATSKFNNPYIPEFKGIEKLEGKMLHSSQYRNAEAFKNKIVAVVGGSLSGTSIAEELAKITQVYHFIRKPRWIIGRYRSSDPKNNGPLLPRDLLKTYASSLTKLSPEEEYEFMLQHCAEQNEIPEWCMKPDSPIGFVVADDYLSLLRSGNLQPIRGNIDYFSESKLILEDERSFNFDVIIFCTGYFRDLTFLPENLRLRSALYEDTFPPGTENIAFIGMYPEARGAVFPLIELQAKLACAVFSNRYQLPSTETMLAEIASMPSSRNEVAFTSSLATRLGVIPELKSLSPDLCHILVNGAYTPARFLLNTQPELAITTIKETEYYRRKLLHSKDKIPSLSSLCFFKLQSLQIEKATQDDNRPGGSKVIGAL